MSVSAVDMKEKLCQIITQEPHKVFDPEGLLPSIKPAAGKDPQQKQQAIEEIKADLAKLVKEGKIREVSDGVFKARLFTNETKHIEHVFIGGMGNTHFRFQSPIFRINIGVISVFFIKGESKAGWMVLVRDSTGGTSFCLTSWLKDGAYEMGSDEGRIKEKGYICIRGRYVEKNHLTLEIRGETLNVEDHMTVRGSRADLLTVEGTAVYREAAQEFLKQIDANLSWDPVSRGRYIMDQLLKKKRDFEATFFGAAVDSILIQKSAPGAKSK